MTDELDDILEKYDASLERREVAKVEKKQQEHDRATELTALRDDVVMPVLVEAEHKLNARGHDASASRPSAASARIDVRPKGLRSRDAPFLEFLFRDDEVSIQGSNVTTGGGRSGPRRSIPIADLTSAEVKNEVVAWAREVLEGPWQTAHSS